MLVFQKKFSDKEKKSIDVVIFHDDNNDGVVGAYIAWKYLMLDNKQEVKFIGLKPGKGRGIERRMENLGNLIKNKNVLILDLAYNKDTLNYVNDVAKLMIVIDDHFSGEKYANPNIFVGENHAAVAYAWKFFYPKEKVPKIVQYVDDSDAKLFLPYVAFPDLFSSALGFRFVHNIFMPTGSESFEKLHELFKTDNVNFFIFLGKYFEEVRNNLKDQIAINARLANFQGYRVAVLNFNSPALSKPVGRQMVSNFEKSGNPIDFAVLWGFEYSAQPPAYRVQLIDDHKQTKLNMSDFASRLGKLGGHPKSGGGHGNHIGNFYWTKDIFDLFKHQYL
jgi:hypothetical protein